MKWASQLTDDELLAELATMAAQEADLKSSLEESGGGAGSPMEWLYERWEELETAAKRRGLRLPGSGTEER